MVIASGLLALVVGAAFATLLISVIELRAQERRTARSQQVLITANELERLVVDLETGVRGYAITGQERFLAPWRDAQAALPAVSSSLAQQVNGGVQRPSARSPTSSSPPSGACQPSGRSARTGRPDGRWWRRRWGSAGRSR